MSMTPIRDRGRTTDPKLLEQVIDWRDSQAWSRFVGQYEPHLRGVCRRYGLAGDRADECCQQVWEKLAAEMRRFRYDPGRRFRGWLHRYFQSRVKDVLKASKVHPFEERLTADMASDVCEPGDDDSQHCDPEFLAMLRQAEEVQTAVRARVTPDNWQVFRLIGIEGWAVAETAGFLGREYTSVYRAYKRVSRMVGDERRRRQAGPPEEMLGRP
jgi:RNA polymerase sigma factor (sigma-70 family)